MSVKTKLSFLILFVGQIIVAQNNHLSFKRLTVENGLSESWIRCIFQDSKGFMWFGTADGLNKYDGYSFKIYRNADQNGDGLSDVSVHAVYEDENNDLWILTSHGISILKNNTETFEKPDWFPDKSYTCILRDSKKNFWLGTTEGLLFFNPSFKTVKTFSKKDHGLSNDHIMTIFEDFEKNIWVGTRNGLNVLNSDSTFFSFYHTGEKGSLAGNDIWSLIQDNQKRLFIGSGQGGIDLLHRNNPDKREWKFTTVFSGSINRLLIDQDNVLWICQGGGGGLCLSDLDQFGEKTLIAECYSNEPDNENSLSDNSVYSICQDFWGDIWIGTYGNGINYYNRRSKKFETNRQNICKTDQTGSNHINCFLEDGIYLWIGTENGLLRLNRENGKITFYHHDKTDAGSLGSNAVYSLCMDAENNLLVGTWAGGLNVFNRRTNTFLKYKSIPGQKGSISNNHIFSIVQDRRKNLWIGTVGGGMNLFDSETRTFRSFVHDENDKNSIRNNYVNAILESNQGNLYIATSGHLQRYDYESGNFIRVSLNPGNHPQFKEADMEVLFSDSRGNIWAGTTGGLICYNEEKNFSRLFTTKDGLPNNYIKGILEDDHGNLWISTNMGISKFVQGILLPEKTEIKNFNIYDGLQGNEFVKRSAYKDKQGYMYFGGTNGYTRFHPDSIQDNPVIPPVIITEFMVMDRSFPVVSEQKDEVPVYYLKHHESVISFKFSSLNYLAPENNRYKYKLEGFENKWNETEGQRRAVYTNLSHGSYLFRVKASNDDDLWNEKGALVRIIILPPWWKTVWFKVLAGMMVLFVIFLIFRFRLHGLRRQKQLLEEKVRLRTDELSNANRMLNERQEEILAQNNELERHRNNLESLVKERTTELEKAIEKAQESDKLKSAFLSNVSHEIRTPMNAIVGFSNLLSNTDIDTGEKKKFVHYIQNSCETLNVLINDIVEISLIETNQVTIQKSVFTPDKILTELEEYYNLKNTKDLSIRFVRNAEELTLYNDPFRFKQVFSNLLNNALKFTEKGFIEFGYLKKEKEVVFYTKDSGIGIDKKEHRKIFDYFYKIEDDKNKLYPGTGIGLYLCNRYVTLMGGEISVESKPGKGSTFLFTLPYSPVPEKATSKEETKRIWPDWKSVTILVAEDEVTNYNLIHAILKPTGAKILWAKNGKEAVEMVLQSTEKPIVLMDIKMPVMNGDEACRLIKEHDPAIGVIAITAYAFQVEKEKISKAGFDVYITKPLDQKRLFRSVNRFVSVNNNPS